MSSNSEVRKRHHVLAALGRYWPHGFKAIEALPILTLEPIGADRANMVLVPLPDWAADIEPRGGLLVPTDRISLGTGAAWQRTDWLGAAFDLLECVSERAYERTHGPVHSYAFRLRDWDTRLWEHAWVNRIALFLRRWAAQVSGNDEVHLFGAPPTAEILLTHDVDAIEKTSAIRLKQGAFGVFNAARAIAGRRWRAGCAHAAGSARFLFGSERYDYLAEVADLESERGLSATFHFNAGRHDGLKSWLFDPSYDVTSPAVRIQIEQLAEAGNRIGLHPSFDAWGEADRIEEERARLEIAAGVKVTCCRQHWLRFAWSRTWEAQAEAGLTFDTTLGFNDRPAFRNAAALRWHPWDEMKQCTGRMEAVPLLFMDSHFYDYLQFDDAGRQSTMHHWLDEVCAVGGVVSVLWHPHTLASDYGWRHGFVQLLDALEAMQ